MENNANNKILVSFLREYNLWNKTGFKNIGSGIKVPTYDYYNQITNSINGEYIDNIEENFKNNVKKILPADLGYQDGPYEDYLKMLLSRYYLIDDEYVYDFRNSLTKLYSYGLGYNEPDKTIGYMNEPDPERVQIVSPTPLLVRLIDNDKIKDIKLVANPYGAYKLNLNPNNPVKALIPSQEHFKNCIDTLQGIGDTSSRFYFATTKKLGSVDKKDTEEKTDSYWLTKIEKIHLSYVTEDKDGYLIKDSETDTTIKRLNWKGEVLPDEIVEVKEYIYYNNTLSDSMEIEGQIYVITVSKQDEKLSLREIKAIPQIITQLRQKMHDCRIKYEERIFEEVIKNSKFDNMYGKFVELQPFCNMGDDSSIEVTEEHGDIVTTIGRKYNFEICSDKIKQYILDNDFIRINNKIYRIDTKQHKKFGVLDNLFNGVTSNENLREILLTKFTPSTNSVYFVTLENFKNDSMSCTIQLSETDKIFMTLTETAQDINDFLKTNKNILDLIVNINLDNIDKSKNYFGSCDSVAMFQDTGYKVLIDGTIESNVIPIHSSAPGAKFYNDNIFNTIVIDF